MGTAQFIHNAALRMRGYAERLLKDVPDHMYARKPTWGLGGKEIDTNHPAWVFGHLALYPPRIVQMLGGSVEPPPAAFEPLFKNGAPCLDDPRGTVYPSMAAINAEFFRQTDAALAALAKATDKQLEAPTPDETARKHFPTVGEMCLFMLNNHVAMHLGQISAWRRCMGLPPA